MDLKKYVNKSTANAVAATTILTSDALVYRLHSNIVERFKAAFMAAARKMNEKELVFVRVRDLDGTQGLKATDEAIEDIASLGYEVEFIGKRCFLKVREFPIRSGALASTWIANQ